MPKKIKCNCDHDLGSMPLTIVRLQDRLFQMFIYWYLLWNKF